MRVDRLFRPLQGFARLVVQAGVPARYQQDILDERRELVPGGDAGQADAKIGDLVAVLCGDDQTGRLVYMILDRDHRVRLDINGVQAKLI